MKKYHSRDYILMFGLKHKSQTLVEISFMLNVFTLTEKTEYMLK